MLSLRERESDRKSLEGRKRMMQRRRIPAFRRRRPVVVLLVAVLFLQECTAARTEDRSGASLPETTRRRRRRRRLKLGVEPVVETKPQNEEPQQHTVPADEPQQMEQKEITAVDNADETCTVSGPCEQCTDSERVMVPEACMATGKRQPYTCVKDTNGTDNVAPAHTVFQSCDRTADDDEFSVMRFQIVCLLAGVAALVSVKQQKASAASLFDQRKLNLRKKRRTSDNPNDVEMTSLMTRQQQQQEETKSLLQLPETINENSLDIV